MTIEGSIEKKKAAGQPRNKYNLVKKNLWCNT